MAGVAEFGMVGAVQDFMKVDRREHGAALVANLDARIFQRTVLGNVLARDILGAGHRFRLRFVEIGKFIALMIGDLPASVTM